jgi:hypothetical protein
LDYFIRRDQMAAQIGVGYSWWLCIAHGTLHRTYWGQEGQSCVNSTGMRSATSWYDSYWACKGSPSNDVTPTPNPSHSTTFESSDCGPFRVCEHYVWGVDRKELWEIVSFCNLIPPPKTHKKKTFKKLGCEIFFGNGLK